MFIKKITSASMGLLTLASAQAQHAELNQKMNVLFIAVDDLKPVLGCYGDGVIKTPNIDKLAANGTVFLQNYCQQAVSGPTRASLLTGKRPDYTKVWDLKTKMRDVNPDILTIPQFFSNQGYVTTGIGKIFDPRCVDNAKQLDKQSWTLPYNFTSSAYYHNNQQPFLRYYQSNEAKEFSAKINNMPEMKGKSNFEKIEYGASLYKPAVECIDVPDNAYNDGAQTTNALELISNLSKGNKPFFFAVGFARPHLPFVSPKRYWDLYNREEIPLAEFQEHAKNSPVFAYTNSGELLTYTDIPALASFTDVKANRIGVDKAKQKELIHGYYASVSYIDAQIGRIIAKLDELGLRKNTIIVLWGDHGWHLGDHDLWCKHTNFENATRAPLIISMPNIKASKTSALTEFVDIFPTLCDLTGLQIPQVLDGKSLVPLMKNPTATIKDYAVSQYPHDGKMGYSIRTSNYRLTWWMEKGFRSNNAFSSDKIVAKELYDYIKDPLEKVNVVDDISYKAIGKDLDKKMQEFFASQRTDLK